MPLKLAVKIFLTFERFDLPHCLQAEWRNSCLRRQPRNVLGSFGGVVLMSCKVNFPVVR